VLYGRRCPTAVITTGVGARLGAASGGIGFGIAAVLTSVGMLLFPTGNEMRDRMLEAIEQSAARYPAPEAQATIQYLKSPQGLTIMLALGLAMTLAFFVVLSTLGGVIGASVVGKRTRY